MRLIVLKVLMFTFPGVRRSSKTIRHDTCTCLELEAGAMLKIRKHLLQRRASILHVSYFETANYLSKTIIVKRTHAASDQRQEFNSRVGFHGTRPRTFALH